MPDHDNDPSGTPEEAPRRNTTGPLSLVAGNGEGLRAWLRIMGAGILGVLLMGDIFLYTLHQALQARVESLERRNDRLTGVVDSLLTSNEDAEKIEKIEQQVDGIGGQVEDLTDAIKAQDAKADAEEVEAAANPKKKR